MIHPNFPDKSTTENPPKLLEQVRNRLRVKHYSIRTEDTYIHWIKRYIYFHGKLDSKRVSLLASLFVITVRTTDVMENSRRNV